MGDFHLSPRALKTKELAIKLCIDSGQDPYSEITTGDYGMEETYPRWQTWLDTARRIIANG